MPSSINEALMKLQRRAEAADRATLVATFVDVGPLFTLLSSTDHQVLYGRRGTGKTHVLAYVQEAMRKRGDCAIYLDMRTLGSTGGLYADSTIPIAQRATRLLADTLGAIDEGLYEYFVDHAEQLDLSHTGPLLDHLANAITEVVVTGTIERGRTTSGEVEATGSTRAELSMSSREGPKATLGGSSAERQTQHTEHRSTESGVAEVRIHFGAVGQAFGDLARAMQPSRIWVFLDEWSSVPIDLQPLLADLLRRCIFPLPGVTVKIAAIEQRSRFRIATDDRGYIGLELGADITADLSLDDYMVFENNADGAKRFFRELLFKHAKAIESALGIESSEELVSQGFTQQNVFDEFVQAAEGVPRDAINIINLAAQRAVDNRIGMQHIRMAARDWYQRDKETAAVREDEKARDLLDWIISTVIGTRKARAFLLKSGRTPELIDTLFDSRLLHVLKRNISLTVRLN